MIERLKGNFIQDQYGGVTYPPNNMELMKKINEIIDKINQMDEQQ